MTIWCLALYGNKRVRVLPLRLYLEQAGWQIDYNKNGTYAATHSTKSYT